MIGLQTAVNDANEEAVAGGEELEEEGRRKSGGGGGGRRSGALVDLDVLEVSALDEVGVRACVLQLRVRD